VTKHPTHPKNHYPTQTCDLHELPSVTNFEDALVAQARQGHSGLAGRPSRHSRTANRSRKLPSGDTVLTGTPSIAEHGIERRP